MPAATGYLTGLDLAKAYASSDIFPVSQHTDTFGNVVIEAFASGLGRSWFPTRVARGN